MLDAAKSLAVELTGLDRDVLHVHLGMVVAVAVLLLTRSRRALALAVVALAAAALANEVADYHRIVAADDPFEPAEAVRDVMNTVLWPLVLLALWGTHVRTHP